MDAKKKIRVLFYIYFRAGGIGKYTDRLLEEMHAFEDLDIEVACLPEYQWRDNSYYKTWPHLLSISHSNPLLRKARFLAGQFINPLRFLKYARETHADIVHFCNFNHLSFPFWSGAVDPGVKLVCTAHDVRRGKSILCQPWEETQIKRFYRSCDALFVHTDQQVSEIQEYASLEQKKVHLVPIGPFGYAPQPHTPKTEIREQYGIPKDKPVGLIFGQIRPEKNTEAMIRALALCKSDVHLVIAGKEASRNAALCREYGRLIQNSMVSERFTFINRYIDDGEIPGLCAMSDWMAAPYLPSFTSESGVLHMAAFYQKPVLVTPTFSHVMAHAPIGVQSRGFADAEIAEAMDDITAQVCSGFAFDFESYRRTYSWKKNADITLQVYKDLVRDRSLGKGFEDSISGAEVPPMKDAAGR